MNAGEWAYFKVTPRDENGKNEEPFPCKISWGRVIRNKNLSLYEARQVIATKEKAKGKDFEFIQITKETYEQLEPNRKKKLPMRVLPQSLPDAHGQHYLPL